MIQRLDPLTFAALRDDGIINPPGIMDAVLMHIGIRESQTTIVVLAVEPSRVALRGFDDLRPAPALLPLSNQIIGMIVFQHFHELVRWLPLWMLGLDLVNRAVGGIELLVADQRPDHALIDDFLALDGFHRLGCARSRLFSGLALAPRRLDDRSRRALDIDIRRTIRALHGHLLIGRLSGCRSCKHADQSGSRGKMLDVHHRLHPHSLIVHSSNRTHTRPA